MTRDTVTVPREAWAEVRHFVECRATDSGTTRDLLNRIDVAAPSSDPEGGARGERALDLLAIEAACKFIYEDKGDRKGVTYVGWDGEPDDVKDQWREDVVATVRAYLDASTKSDGGVEVTDTQKPEIGSVEFRGKKSLEALPGSCASTADATAFRSSAGVVPGPSDAQLTKTPSADHDDGNLRDKLDIAISALEFARDGYERTDIKHIDYRVGVYTAACDALDEIALPSAPNHQPHAVSQGWQGIETAPKDGTRIIAVGWNWGIVGNDQHVTTVIWRLDREEWCESDDDDDDSACAYLTHWMPLPAPPSPAKTGGVE